MRWSTALLAGLVLPAALPLGAVGSLADPLAVCRAANAEVPQLCPCTVERARAAGLGGVQLDRLLGHDYAGLPADVVQRFGAIFVACTHTAVTGGTSAIARPRTPSGTPNPMPAPSGAVASSIPAPAGAAARPRPSGRPRERATPATMAAETWPAPAGPATPAAAGPAIDLDPAPLSRPAAAGPALDLDPARPSRSGSPRYRLEARADDDLRRGRWAPWLALKKPSADGAWEATIAHGAGIDGADGILIAGCTIGASAVLTVGPVRPDLHYERAMITVHGAGGVLLRQAVAPSRIEDDLLQMHVPGDILGALRRGTTVTLEAGPYAAPAEPFAVRLEYALAGSATALDETVGRHRCQSLRVPMPAGYGFELVNGSWERGSLPEDDSGLLLPALRLDTPGPMEDLALRCDGRLHVQPLPKYGAGVGQTPRLRYRYQLAVDGGAPVDVDFVFSRPDSAGATSAEPLSEAVLQAMAGGREVALHAQDMEPGDGLMRSFELTGLGAGLGALACPEIPLPAAAPRIDLTGAGVAWRPVDLGPLLAPGGDGRPHQAPAALLETGDRAHPDLGLYCDGTPYFLAGAFPVLGSVDLRLTVDGDDARTETVDYGNYRAFLNGSPSDGLTAAILAGGTLRVMLVANPAFDLLYPLQGAVAALGAAGC